MSTDGTERPAGFKVITADGKVIEVKAGRTHKETYKIGTLQGNVVNGELVCPLPVTNSWSAPAELRVDSLVHGNQQHVRECILTIQGASNSTTTVAIVKTAGNEATLKILPVQATAPAGQKLSTVRQTLQRMPNILHLLAEVGRAAQRMIHQ